MLSNALRKRHPYRVFKDKINELEMKLNIIVDENEKVKQENR